MENFVGFGSSDMSKTVRKKRSNRDTNAGHNTNFQRKYLNLNQCSSGASYMNLAGAEASLKVSNEDIGFGESNEYGIKNIGECKEIGMDVETKDVAPSNWRKSNDGLELLFRAEDTHINEMVSGSHSSGQSRVASHGQINENKLRKVKLKLGGVIRTIHPNSTSDGTSMGESSSIKSSRSSDTPSPLPKLDVQPVRKSNRTHKRRLLDGKYSFGDDDNDEEIRYLEKLNTGKVAHRYSTEREDQSEDGSKKHCKISRVLYQTDARDYGLLRSVKKSKNSRSGRVSADNDYMEDEEPLFDGEPESRRKKQRKEYVDMLGDSNKEMAVTTRQQARRTGKDISSGFGASVIEFPNGLPPSPSRKQKEKLSEVDQQLKKAEAAQRRKLQMDKAARESEAEAIRKILGQDSSRKKREDKVKKRQEELAQERTANATSLPSNTVRWVMCPTGTAVTFPDDMGLPSILQHKHCRRMGFISRKIFPACGNMCVCCPALRSRSRQPVKRYKKLLAEIFPKSPDAPPNDRKIVKLCEYAAKNPFRIPKITKYLEERCCKELRSEHIKFVNMVAEVYNKLLSICKEQMAYFAVNLLNVVVELLDNSKRDAVQIIGCQTLTRFIYSQVDGTYTYNIENLVHKVCTLARLTGEDHQKRCLRASSLQCLSAMVWYMAEFSHIFANFDEIVHVTLDNYEPDTNNEDIERGEAHHNWVDEVVRCEGRGGAGVGGEISPSYMIIRPRPEKRDPSLLTREEVETPKVWAQICIQRMVELAKESTTMRLILDPMFVYFDTRRHWLVPQGLAMMVLSDMSYYVEYQGNQPFILTAVVRHLDHKNVSHDPKTKSDIIQTAAVLARQIRSIVVLSDIGFVNDLCRHMRKSLQASVESAGEQELSLNITLQNSIEDCLRETAKGIADTRPLFDMMAITLENLPSSRTVAKATIGSLMVLADMISLASSHSKQVFPEALLVQLLKVMLHTDVEFRVGGHQIFSVLLIPTSNHPRYDASTRTKSWQSNTASEFASIATLLEKLRREKDGTKVEKQGTNVQDCFKERDNAEEEWKQGWARKNSPNFNTLSSIIDRTAGSTSLAEAEPSIMKFSEDQITQLLSAFFVQANLPDNLPSNIEAIAHSFYLTLISSRLRSSNGNLVVRFFQLPLSLRRISLDPANGMLPPAYQRSLLVLSTSMLQFAVKIYQIPHVNELLKSSLGCDVDPYVDISDDFQVYVKPQANLSEFGFANDNQVCSTLLFELRNKICESENIILDLLVQSLSNITKVEADDLVQQLSEAFAPDDTFMYGPQSILDLDHTQEAAHSKESLSFDADFPTNSSVEDDVTSESSVADITGFIPKLATSPSLSHIISIGQLLESALEVAGQVAGTSVSTSPLPFSAMASQCQALGTDTRKKLTNWLSHDNHYVKAAAPLITFPADDQPSIRKILGEDGPVCGPLLPMESRLALRLPPASPFDNFLRAARH